MKKKILISLIVCCFVFSTYPVIMSLKQLEGPEGQLIFLYGDFHRYDESKCVWAKTEEEFCAYEAKQLDALKRLLCHYVVQQKKVHCFVESPGRVIFARESTNCGVGNYKDTSLFKDFTELCISNKLLLPYIISENIDTIRQDLSYAYYILSLPTDSHQVEGPCKVYLRKGIVPLQTLTFSDLQQEVNNRIKELKSHPLYTGYTKMQHLVDGYSAHIEEQYKYLEELLANLAVSPQDSILETAQVLVQRNRAVIEQIKIRLRCTIYAPLLEISMLQKILVQNKEKIVFLFAGHDHIEVISGFLKVCYGYREKKDVLKTQDPLSPEELCFLQSSAQYQCILL